LRWRDVKQNRIPPALEDKTEVDLYADINFAGNLDKIKSFITDTFMIVMPIVYIVFYIVMGDRQVFSENLFSGWAYILISMAIVIVPFYTLKGQTPGLRAYDLKVIDIKTKEKPSLVLSITRYIFFTINFLSLFGLFYSFFRDDKRGIHDLLSGTAIIKDSDDKK